MKIEDCTMEELKNLGRMRKYTKGKCDSIVEQFGLSGKAVIRLVPQVNEYKNIHSLRSSIRNSINRSRFKDILTCNVIVGQCYLINKELIMVDTE